MLLDKRDPCSKKTKIFNFSSSSPGNQTMDLNQAQRTCIKPMHRTEHRASARTSLQQQDRQKPQDEHTSLRPNLRNYGSRAGIRRIKQQSGGNRVTTAVASCRTEVMAQSRPPCAAVQEKSISIRSEQTAGQMEEEESEQDGRGIEEYVRSWWWG